jgi:hypothetical protein
VLLIKKLGLEEWKRLKDAGRRWIAEIVFSSIKRVLGENLLSRKSKAQKIEARLIVITNLNQSRDKVFAIIEKYNDYLKDRIAVTESCEQFQSIRMFSGLKNIVVIVIRISYISKV